MLIRTQEKVPEVYVNDSRDFQVLCRAYDVLYNMIKFDTDSMLSILSASNVRNNVLPLLQGKLGFFTSKTIDDTSMRKILGAFPILLRGKGSLRAIKQAIYVWLKIAHLETAIDISITTDKPISIGQITIPPYTVAIGIRSRTRDLTILKEILKYIIPAGFGMYFYFYYGLDITEQNPQNIFEDKAKLAFISDDINSIIRSDNEKSYYEDAMEANEIIKNDGDSSHDTVNRIYSTVTSISAYGSEVNPTGVFGYSDVPKYEYLPAGWLGITSSTITENSTLNPIVINGNSVTVQAGNITIDTNNVRWKFDSNNEWHKI